MIFFNNKIIYYICILNFVFSNENRENLNNKYNYNDNGRIIIPSRKVINKLPKDGGEL